MIIDGRFDWAAWEMGPIDRIIYPDNDLSVIIGHSLEGRRGSYSTMADPAKHPTAWHWTVAQSDGALYQHYRITAGLAASNAGNLKGPAGESEGFAGEPLTPPQVQTWLRIIRDMEALTGRRYRPGVRREGFTEHNHWGQTACPSGRYQPLYDAIAAGALEDDLFEEAEDMTPEEREEHQALVALLGGRANLLKQAADGDDLWAGYAIEQAKLGALIQTVEAHTKTPHAGGLAPGTEFTATVT